MNALLIVSHGSRRHASNEEVISLANIVHPLIETKFNLVTVAFLELAKPSTLEGINQCIDQGAKQILVVPYFLAAGLHVSKHIPKIIEQARNTHKEVTIELAGHIGGSDYMAQLLADHVSL